MCGRFTQTKSKSELEEIFGLPNIPAYEAMPWSPTEAPARFNIAPTQDVLIVRAGDEGRVAAWVRWGLVPPSAKTLQAGNKMINLRSETIFDRALFKRGMTKRRCLIPTDGFFEWRRVEKTKQPFHIQTKGGGVFAMAGIFERWTSPNGSIVETCTVLTCAPNPLVAELHDRMPVIIPQKRWTTWLDPAEGRETIEPLLVALDKDEMMMTAVSQAANSVKNDTPECIEPAPELKPDQIGFGF